MALMDIAAISESAINKFANGGETAIDTRPPMTRLWAIDVESKFILKKFMIF